MHVASTQMRCGDEWHTIRIADGRLQFPDHPDLQALYREVNLLKLGAGGACGCAVLLHAWRAGKRSLLYDERKGPPSRRAGDLAALHSGEVTPIMRRYLRRRRRRERDDPTAVNYRQLVEELLALADKSPIHEAWPRFAEAVFRELLARGLPAKIDRAACHGYRTTPKSLPQPQVVHVAVAGAVDVSILGGVANNISAFVRLQTVPQWTADFRLSRANSKSPGNLRPSLVKLADRVEDCYLVETANALLAAIERRQKNDLPRRSPAWAAIEAFAREKERAAIVHRVDDDPDAFHLSLLPVARRNNRPAASFGTELPANLAGLAIARDLVRAVERLNKLNHYLARKTKEEP